ncbi:MAG: glycine zipper 2TM domain-containing protein [Burkholderiales bacterium]|nr:glycine zipper 2TM domain-containing protein [Burkholderiales bacterium]MDE2076847.1 glycine zipper 2TM domain-containing protein [Burkholderiales bacterium]MDE2434312.1 glycine zipper 2TM domain-containing protein [Burkholderiales bacterium]
MNRTFLAGRLSILATTALALSTAACAGPRVGEVIGAPSSSTTTIRARVVSSTPVVAQVAVPRQVCYDELRQEPARSSGAGAIMGAIAGGAMGNAVGKGSGRVLTTGLGVILGAAMGDHIENDGRAPVSRTYRRCDQQTSYQNQVVAYNVVYEYGGQRYSTQMQHEPGATIPVSVTVNPGDQVSYDNEPPAYYQPQPVVVTPAPVRYVVQPAPITQVVYQPVVPVVRGWDHHHDRDDDDWEDHDEHHGRRGGWHDDGRAVFTGRWGN